LNRLQSILNHLESKSSDLRLAEGIIKPGKKQKLTVRTDFGCFDPWCYDVVEVEIAFQMQQPLANFSVQ